MDPYIGIAELLWANAAFKAATPGGISDTVRNPNAPMPDLTFQVAGGGGAPGLSTSGPQKRRIQFDARGNTAASAKASRNALRKALNGFSGALPNGFILSAAWLINEIDYFDSDARQFRAMAEYYILFAFQDS
jgi:hypothetical protein